MGAREQKSRVSSFRNNPHGHRLVFRAPAALAVRFSFAISRQYARLLRVDHSECAVVFVCGARSKEQRVCCARIAAIPKTESPQTIDLQWGSRALFQKGYESARCRIE